jgi:hypothetical protein
MQLSLTKKLVEKGVIKTETEIEAMYEAIDLSGVHRTLCRGNFVIMSIKDAAEPIFEIASGDGKRKRIKSESIISVDGMDPARLASIYNIKADGSDKPVGKRRGRKPKVRDETDLA